jgi:hypothetical protein
MRISLLLFSEQAENPELLKFLSCSPFASLTIKNPEGGRIPFKKKLNSPRATM